MNEPLRLNVELGFKPLHDDTIRAMVFEAQEGGKPELWEVWLGEPDADGVVRFVWDYRVEFCKPAGIWYCHASGGGPVNSPRDADGSARDRMASCFDGLLLWLAPNVERPWQVGEGSPQLLAAPPPHVTQEFLDEIHDHGELDFWCDRCKSMIPGDYAYLCKHSWWCDRCGCYSTPSERCPHNRKQAQQ